jgi:hypothetical protein
MLYQSEMCSTKIAPYFLGFSGNLLCYCAHLHMDLVLRVFIIHPSSLDISAT